MSNDSNWDSGWNTSGSGNPWDFEPKDPLGGWESGSSGAGRRGTMTALRSGKVDAWVLWLGYWRCRWRVLLERCLL